MIRKAVVFGAAGQLGREIVRELSARGAKVTGWDRAEVDITDAEQVERAIAGAMPDVAFNCAAYNQVDVAEKEPQAAFQVNALAVRNIALACRQADAQLIHFSTDYVFDGASHAPYVEDDPTHPLNAYAVSKLSGELYAQAYLERALVVRTSGVFGPGALQTARGNFVELMLRLARAGAPIRVVEDHVASPTYAPLLAARTLDLVERRQCGVWHVGGGTPISWFDYARMIFDMAGIEAPLEATNEREYRTSARRPKFSALSNGKLERFSLPAMPPLKDALADYFTVRRRLLSSV